MDAQQARAVLDYLVGFNLSPFLWKKIRYGLSAGRVQSVALRLVCEREKEIQAFKEEEYWTIAAQLATAAGQAFTANLVEAEGKKLGKFDIPNQESADRIVADLTRCQVRSRLRIPGNEGDQERTETHSRSPLYHLHPAAGGCTQTRIFCQKNDVHCPEAV